VNIFEANKLASIQFYIDAAGDIEKRKFVICGDCERKIYDPSLEQTRCQVCKEKRKAFFKNQYHNDREAWDKHQKKESDQ